MFIFKLPSFKNQTQFQRLHW